MALPPLVYYPRESDYRSHYKRVYCRGRIITFDEIRVYFQPQKFEHAFYEGVGKTRFSPARAERIDWVKATLEHDHAELYQGWDKRNRVYVPDRRVNVVFEDFVVVIELVKQRDRNLKGKFITCYKADNSIRKIRNAPAWDIDACLRVLEDKGGR